MFKATKKTSIKSVLYKRTIVCLRLHGLYVSVCIARTNTRFTSVHLFRSVCSFYIINKNDFYLYIFLLHGNVRHISVYDEVRSKNKFLEIQSFQCNFHFILEERKSKSRHKNWPLRRTYIWYLNEVLSISMEEIAPFEKRHRRSQRRGRSRRSRCFS